MAVWNVILKVVVWVVLGGGPYWAFLGLSGPWGEGLGVFYRLDIEMGVGGA